MTQRMRYTRPAPSGQIFAPDSFASQVGKTVPLTLEGSPLERDCRVVEAVVSESGTSVELTVDVDADIFPPEVFSANGFRVVED